MEKASDSCIKHYIFKMIGTMDRNISVETVGYVTVVAPAGWFGLPKQNQTFITQFYTYQ